MTSRSILTLAILLLSSNVRANPWRPETGLPSPAPSGAPYTVEAPTTVDGVEHPYLDWRGLQLGLLGDAFVTYEVQRLQGQWLNEFELSRVQPTFWASYRGVAGMNVTLESIRSSSSTSYLGIQGDSIVTRIKWAFAEATPLKRWLSLRAGLIPDLLLEYVEASWAFRMQGPVGIERDGFFTTGDLGGSIEAALPAGFGSVAVSYTNGEGITLPEQNNGKDTTVAIRIAPLRFHLPGLLIHLLYRDGSVGAASAADSRLAGGVTYAGRRLGLGAIGAWAIGYQGVGSRDAGHLSVWGRGELPYRFFLIGRVDMLWPDTRDASSMQARFIAGVAYALPAIVRLLVDYEGTVPFGTLSNQVPSVTSHALLVQVEARL